MPDPTRVGIVGATVTLGGSGWGANAHVPALRALPNYQLRAVCTAHEATAAASAARFGAELAFHGIDDLVAHPDIDLVVVSVRVPGHHELVMEALRAGKPVFYEWPLGATLEEAEEMANLARERDLPTAVGLQARSDPSVRYARDLIAQGYVGEVLIANLSVMSQAVLERGPGRSWQAVRANGANPLTQGPSKSDKLVSDCGPLRGFRESGRRLGCAVVERSQRVVHGERVAMTCPPKTEPGGMRERLAKKGSRRCQGSDTASRRSSGS